MQEKDSIFLNFGHLYIFLVTFLLIITIVLTLSLPYNTFIFYSIGIFIILP